MSLEWIRRHARTPKKDTELSEFPGYWVDRISPEKTAPLIWKLQVSASKYKQPPQEDNPLNDPAEISVDFQLIDEPTLFDHKNRPIVTTAGEWIAGVMRKQCHIIYKVSKKLGADPGWMETHPAAINSDAVRIRGKLRPRHSLMMTALQMSPYETKNRISFTTAQFDLHYAPEGWIQKIWNRGTKQLVEFTTAENKKIWKQVQITTGTPAVPVDQPVPLDKSGRVIEGALTPGEKPFDISKLVVLEVQTQVDRPFQQLPLI